MPARRATSVSLPTPLVAEAQSLARRKRKTVAAVVSTALERYLAEERTARQKSGPKDEAKPARRSARGRHAGRELLRIVFDSFKDVPPEAWKKLPRDGSINPDRYIYGRP